MKSRDEYLKEHALHEWLKRTAPSGRAKRMAARVVATYEDYARGVGKWARHLDARAAVYRYAESMGGTEEDAHGVIVGLVTSEAGEHGKIEKRIARYLGGLEGKEEG